MGIDTLIPYPSLLLSYDLLFRKPLFFSSLTGLTIYRFDDIKENEITKRYRKRETGTGRPFKLDVKDKFLMFLVYYHLYLTYALACCFLFNLDQNNICSDIQKIESLIEECLPIHQKIYNITKRLKTPEEVEKFFPGFLAFIDYTEQQIPRSVEKKREGILFRKKKKHTIKNQLMVNNHGYIIHKTGHRKGRRHGYNI